MERKISIQGTSAIAHAWECDPKERRVDYSPHVRLLAETMGDLLVAKKERCIVIEGVTGSGKSMLAQVLVENGANCLLVDMLTDSNPQLTDTAKTVIIDEAALASAEFWPQLTLHLEAGGAAVVFVQSRLDIGGDEWPVLTLDRNGLYEKYPLGN